MDQERTQARDADSLRWLAVVLVVLVVALAAAWFILGFA